MIIHTGNLKSFYQKHQAEIIKIQSELCSVPAHASLEPFGWEDENGTFIRYIDSEGHTYSRFGKKMGLPVDRLGNKLKFFEYLSKGLSPAEDEQMDKIIGDAIENGLKNPKHKSAAIIGTVLTEKERRRSLSFHVELFYNILAVQVVRDDEDPYTYTNAIQLQKVEAFKKEQHTGNLYFFFQQPELKNLSDLLKITPQDVERLLTESKAELEVMHEKLAYLASLNTTFPNGNKSGKED